MGLSTYGLYILMQTATGYLLIFCLGAGSATFKYVAQFNADPGAGLKQTLRHGLMMHVIGALAGAAVFGLGAQFFIVHLFRVPQSQAAAGVFVLRCAAIAAIFMALIQFAVSIMQGLRRFDLQNLVAFLQNGLAPVGAAAAIAWGLGLHGAAIWFAAWNAAVCLLALILAWRILPERSGRKAGPGFNFKTFAGYGLSLWFGPLAWIVTFQFDKIFIARAASLSALTLYAVPAGILQRLQVLPAIVGTVLLPMISELKGPDAPAALRRMYLKSVRFVLWLLLPVFVLLFALMPQFLTLWLGGEFGDRSVWPARWLVIAQVFLMIHSVPNAVVASRDKPWHLSAVAWAQAIISLLAWKLLIGRYELLGVALGSLLAQIIPACFYLAYVHRNILKISFKEYYQEGLRAPCLSAAIMLGLVFPFHASATSWPLFALFSLGGMAIFYGSTWFLCNPEDRTTVREFMEPA
ncbi:MAG: hypothetical protein A3J74_01505 [Elusimicrobia bacterium RIFCSPHIGHO2_02_FULL_57_9]|nr:MAG: hypothetical protein A3J74_01505 [Elusimicrobia bacterium RIFCSPHIGHO2_02_FULL_57_9]